MKAAQMASADWKDPSMEGPLRQGPVSSQPAPLSALGAPEKQVGPLSASLGHSELRTLSRSALICKGTGCHEADYSHCVQTTPRLKESAALRTGQGPHQASVRAACLSRRPPTVPGPRALCRPQPT